MTDHAKRTKRAHEDETLSLDEHIQRRRGRLVAQRLEVENLRRRVDAMREDAGRFGSRWQTRMRADLLHHAQTLETECDVRESMSREHHFEILAVTYMQRYYASGNLGARKSALRGDAIGPQHHDVRMPSVSQQRATIVDEYLTDIHEAPAKVVMCTRDVCPRCTDAPVSLLVCPRRSIMTCPTCGYCVAYLDATSSTTSFDEAIEFSQYSYKRVNHYMMWLSVVQGKEAHQVQGDVLQTVMQDLYTRLHIRNTEQITQKRVRESLRHHRIRRAYDHVTQITARLSGHRPPRISAHMEDKLRNMFLQMQPSFQRHAPKTRTNFLSYSYVLYRCFQILGRHDMLEGITLLKGRDKLEANDAIFRKMCHDLGWPTFDLPPSSQTVV